MEIVALVFRYLHFIGLAAVLSSLIGTFDAVKEKGINRIVIRGLWIQLITGIILVGLREPEVDHIKVTVKFSLLLLMIFIALRSKRKNRYTTKEHTGLRLAAFIEIAIAVFW